MENELNKIRDAMDKTILRGHHFSEIQKRKIRNKLNQDRTSPRYSLKHFFPRILGFTLSFIFIMMATIFILNILNESDLAIEPEKTETINPTNYTEDSKDPINNDSATSGDTIDKVDENSDSELPKTLAALSIGKAVKGTGDLVTKVVDVKKVPQDNGASTSKQDFGISVIVSLENRGEKDLFISTEQTMKLLNKENEELPKIRSDKSLDGTIKPGQLIEGEIVFATTASDIYKFYFVDLDFKVQTVWLLNKSEIEGF